MLASRHTSDLSQRSVAVPHRGDDALVLGRLGPLEVRLADSDAEIDAAQKLRYRVFHEEMGAQNAGGSNPVERDEDWIDAICDHLIVVDTSTADRGVTAVGTYRLLPHQRARAAGGFYSDSEFELSELVSRHPDKHFLELGRSCVLPQYRTRRVVELLWQGIWAYCRRHDVDVMTGCASFPGTIPARHALALSFLYHFYRVSGEWGVNALPSQRLSMDLMPAEAINAKVAIAAMPPLIKGYLRIGGKVGDGCVIDRQFNTTDVLIVLPCTSIARRYIDHYGQDATRYAA